MTEPLAYLDGRYLPYPEARLPLHDAGFVLGATVTDLCRTFRKQPFRLADHLERFRRSCSAAFLSLPRTDAELEAIGRQLLDHNGRLLGLYDELALLLFATPGPIGTYAGLPGGPGDAAPTLGLHTFRLPLERFRPLFEAGARLIVPSVRAVPPASVDPHIKQRSRMHWWLADREVHARDPGAAALLADEAGNVTETAAANFLLVRDGRVLTPPAGRVLGGVSLRVVRELCAELRIPVEEQPLPLAACRTADEAMLANTSYCLAGVSRIDGHAIPWPGPVYERLRAAWNARIGLDYAAQILGPR